ncbi:ATP-binding cassette domain-containing protein [Microbacterium sp. NEAU-LLC]|uniref:ATP-binding cassette domain-containing protein n=1 Tax=Microbacterium helvum TaxID=2773713 RepID=A0ABR8NI33_9MICO|nr:ATP-binding cassette domain-containing protein [Microbacterium helvum]MBD3940335.1 ATP-binding cassette domain-containing protein [Microbacterium helvum]
MILRPGPLRAAAVLAAGFVGARVVYRVLFHGADGSGQVLLPLPEVRLAPPFAHVVLLGPVTTDGLVDAAASALPIALAILAFGVLNSLVDLHRVFARASRRGPLRGVARALAIAWATLPSLADGARAVRFAQRLRGERGGVRLLLPVLQRTLERAGHVAAALELRGFAGRGLDGDCLAPVEAHGVSAGFGTDAAPSPSQGSMQRGAMPAEDASGIRLPSFFALEAGTLTLVSGATGSGKSTLLRAIAGLHTHTDGGWMTGSLRVVGHDRAEVPPRDLSQRVGVVLQHPREAFATERVRDEIGLTLELRGVARVIVEARVAEVAERVGITRLLDRPTRGLSAGEATLVAIAAAIVEQPILLLVDEPLADLDAAARVRISDLLGALAHEAGMCVVVAEHRVDALAAVADEVLRIDGGVVARVAVAVAGAHAEAGASVPSAVGPKPQDSTVAGAVSVRSCGLGAPADAARPTVLRARGVTVRHGEVTAVAGADLELRAGEIVALTGPNGAGKSSLLAALALPARGMEIWAAGRVALVPDASDDLFVYDTVAAECARADRRARRAAHGIAAPSAVPAPPPRVHPSQMYAVPEVSRTSVTDEPGGGGGRRDGAAVEATATDGAPTAMGATGVTAARFAGFLGLDPGGPVFAARLARHPLDLSAGERRCLVLAIQLATSPAVVLVDEPTRGLDPAARAVVWTALMSLADEGTAVLVASHEPEIAAHADRVLEMRDGMPAAPARAVPLPDGPAAAFMPQSPGSPDAHAPRRSGAYGTPPQAGPEFRTPPATDGSAAAPPAPESWTPAPRTPAPRTPALRTPRPPRTARPPASRRPLLPVAALVPANLVAIGAFCWPLVATAVPAQAYAAVPVAALALAPLAVLVVIATLDGTVRSAHMLALLGTLAAIGAAVRIASTGVGGVEAVFVLLILAGRAFGARFGMLLGMAAIALSTLVTGTFGPWTPFQMFACAWVGAGAGLLPRLRSHAAEIAMLAVYGVVASYAFGLIMNLWYWPFAVGYGTGISYDGSAPLGVNLSSFLLYSLVTSTLSWDTLRAVTTVIGLVVIGRPVLAALRRAKPLQQPPWTGTPVGRRVAATAPARR